MKFRTILLLLFVGAMFASCEVTKKTPETPDTPTVDLDDPILEGFSVTWEGDEDDTTFNNLRTAEGVVETRQVFQVQHKKDGVWKTIKTPGKGDYFSDWKAALTYVLTSLERDLPLDWQ